MIGFCITTFIKYTKDDRPHSWSSLFSPLQIAHELRSMTDLYRSDTEATEPRMACRAQSFLASISGLVLWARASSRVILPVLHSFCRLASMENMPSVEEE